MAAKTRNTLNTILILLAIFSIYIIIKIPQPYGYIALAVLALTSMFNFIKNKGISLALFTLGFGASLFIFYSAYSFAEYTANQRSKFDIPTAVHFEKSDFQTALAKAKDQNKPLFVDFYTGWCAPCLSFVKNVMTDKEVGASMNEAFINLKYDAEVGEGKLLAKKYGVRSYPTLLILDSEGKLLQNITSESMLPNGKDMIQISK